MADVEKKGAIMNIPRFIIAVIVNYLILWGLAALFYDVLLGDQLAPLTDATLSEEALQPVLVWMLLGYLVMVVLFCLIFLKGYENKGIAEGVRYGLWVGGLLAAGDFVWAIHLQPGVGVALLGAVVSLVMWTIAGAILAAIYKPKATQSVQAG